MDAALSGRGSRVNLASQLFYHYHPSPIVQSEDRPPFLHNTASPPYFSTGNISNLSHLQDTANSQTEAVSMTVSIPHLRSTQTRRRTAVTSTTSASTSGIINWTSPVNSIQVQSANITPHGATSTDISAHIPNEVLSALSSPEFIQSISYQISSRLPVNLQQPSVDPPNINVAGPSHPKFPGPENVDLLSPVQPVSSLPPISTAVMRRISNGEFVEFKCLLSVAPSSPNEFTVSMGNLGDSPAISLAPRSARAKITDLNSWWLAWSTFIRVYLQCFPQRMKQVLGYQASIAQYSTQFLFSDVFMYDRLFRQRMALEPHLKWDRFDNELVFRCLQRHSRPVMSQVLCFSCKRPGHYASACEFQRSDGSFAGSSSRPGATTSFRFRSPSSSRPQGC